MPFHRATHTLTSHTRALYAFLGFQTPLCECSVGLVDDVDAVSHTNIWICDRGKAIDTHRKYIIMIIIGDVLRSKTTHPSSLSCLSFDVCRMCRLALARCSYRRTYWAYWRAWQEASHIHTSDRHRLHCQIISLSIYRNAEYV